MATTAIANLESVKIVEQVLNDVTNGHQSKELTGEEVISHVSDLCQGMRCRFSDLPGQVGVIADAARRRGQSFRIDRTKFKTALWELYGKLTTA